MKTKKQKEWIEQEQRARQRTWEKEQEIKEREQEKNQDKDDYWKFAKTEPEEEW